MPQRDPDWVEQMKRNKTYRVTLEDPPSTNGTAPHDAFYVDASAVQPERIEWLWRSRLALGKMSMLDGDPGLGKSTVSLDIAARVSTGAPFPMEEDGRTPAGVIILSAEDGVADTIVPRLAAAGADLGLVRILLARPDERGMPQPLTIPSAIAYIAEHIQATEAKLMIIDPLMSFFESNTNANSDQDVRAALKPLAEMLERTHCAAIMLRHLNKSDSKNAVYRGGGSIGIIGAARFGSLVSKHPDDDMIRIMAPTKSNLSVEAQPLSYHLEGVWGQDVARVVWANEHARYNAADLMAMQGKSKEEDDELDDVTEFTRDYLVEHGPSTFADMWKEAKAVFGWGDQKMRRGYRNLGIKPRKSPGAGGQWLLALPDHEERPDPGDLPE